MQPQPWKSKLYIAAGFVSIGVGVIGIWTPLLPTTEFLVLAAFCFARGGERWHQWLMTHRIFSPYILAFREKRGMTRAQKLRIASFVTCTLFVTILLIPSLIGKALTTILWAGLLTFFYLFPSPDNRETTRN